MSIQNLAPRLQKCVKLENDYVENIFIIFVTWYLYHVNFIKINIFHLEFGLIVNGDNLHNPETKWKKILYTTDYNGNLHAYKHDDV